MAPAVPTYAPRDSGDTVLYKVIAEHLETFLASCHDDPEATGLPVYVHSIGFFIFPVPEVPVTQG